MYAEQGNTLKEVIIKYTYIGMPKNVVIRHNLRRNVKIVPIQI